MNEKSQVEQFYAALASRMGITVQWHALNFMEQEQFIRGINDILGLMTSLQGVE